MQKQRDFQGGMDFSKSGGLAPRGEKCVFPREKRDGYGQTPGKRPEKMLIQSQRMCKTLEMMPKNSETAHKEPIATRERKSMNSPRSTADREGGLESVQRRIPQLSEERRIE
jgi:hypothetical protein